MKIVGTLGNFSIGMPSEYPDADPDSPPCGVTQWLGYNLVIGLTALLLKKLQFSLFLISCSQGILSSSYSPGIFPKDCLFTCIFHSL